MSIAVRLSEVRARIDAAARRAGRDPFAVRLVAVSKTFPIDAVREAYAAGQRDFGENRVQEALEKIGASPDLDARWHLLGHLQTNKARKAAPAFAMIQSVDSVDLLRKLDAAAADSGHAPELLVQVDLAGEATKFGARPGEVRIILEAGSSCRAARVVGLMTLPPIPDDPGSPAPGSGSCANCGMGG
jgi:pyridoxal phosphate enzyme (YggS family)